MPSAGSKHTLFSLSVSLSIVTSLLSHAKKERKKPRSVTGTIKVKNNTKAASRLNKMYFSQDNGENVYFINGVIFVFTQHRHTRGIKLYVIYIHLFLCYSHVSNVCELIYKTVEYFLFFFFSFGGEGRGGGEESGVERKLSFLFFFGFKLKLHLQPVTCSRSFFFYSI